MKCIGMAKLIRLNQSHPSRGAWIEIPLMTKLGIEGRVAPLAGCVD